MYPDVPQLTGRARHDQWNQDMKEGAKANDAVLKSSSGKFNRDVERKLTSNNRETQTRIYADAPISEVEDWRDNGKVSDSEVEISGDALARFKKGQTPVFHRN